MAGFYSYQPHYIWHESATVKACGMSSLAAVKKVQEIHEGQEVHMREEEKRCFRSYPKWLQFFLSTSLPAQLILGSSAGVISGYLAKNDEKEWAIAVGMGLIVFRFAGQIADRPVPGSICAIPRENMMLVQKIVMDTAVFVSRNIFVIVGYLGGFLAMYKQ